MCNRYATYGETNAEVRPVHPKTRPVILTDPVDLKDGLISGPDYRLQVN